MPKTQITNKSQIPNGNDMNKVIACCLKFDIDNWDSFGICCLGFGVLSAFKK
jgi:hypothetical protein